MHVVCRRETSLQRSRIFYGLPMPLMVTLAISIKTFVWVIFFAFCNTYLELDNFIDYNFCKDLRRYDL